MNKQGQEPRNLGVMGITEKVKVELSKKAKGTGVIEGLETKRVYRACSERGVNINKNKEVIDKEEDFRV